MKNQILLINKTAAAVGLFFLLLLFGCVTLESPAEIIDTPALLRPEAKKLIGTDSANLLVEAKETLSKIPLYSDTIRQIAEKTKMSVVSIYVKTRTPYRVRLLPIRIPGTGMRVLLPGVGLGSGFFIHSSGYILTNNHVIQDAEEISVLMHDETDFMVTIVARDPIYDLALLKVLTPGRQFPVLPMGNSDLIGPGDQVIAMGNPLGLGHTVTSGIVSQTGRFLTGVSNEDARHVKFIQTDAAINPGSSGGPLISLSGAWIGINTLGSETANGIGFAVPSIQVREFLDEIRSGNGLPDTPNN